MRSDDTQQHCHDDPEQFQKLDTHLDGNFVAVKLSHFDVYVQPVIDRVVESELDAVQFAHLEHIEHCY